jgi:hypothetical protein
LWIDVEVVEDKPDNQTRSSFLPPPPASGPFRVPSSRTHMSINLTHVMFCYERADT